MVFAKGFDVICNCGVYAEHTYLTEEVKLNRKLKDCISFQDKQTNSGVTRHQVVNFNFFHDTVPAPSMVFQNAAAFGGASALFEVISEAE